MTRHARPCLATSLTLAAFMVAAALATASGSAQAQEITWPEKLYNPKPSEDGADLVLPMPCGGAMAFRPVAMAANSIAEDQAVLLGDADTSYGYQEAQRTAYFSAPFEDAADRNRRILYMAKYELTAHQLSALTGACPSKPNMKGSIPAMGISWFEAINSAHAYSQWLFENAPESVPKSDGTSGFIRLPTEVEWEYAVRGGLKVGSSEFLASTFPTEGGLAAHAWSVEANSSNGKPKPVGLKRPNPLGLHDMLGNADEIVFEPFHLTHVDRQHGLVGGFVIRGGNYLMSGNSLRSAYRSEVPFYRKGRPGFTATAGTRFVLSAEIVSSREKLQTIQLAWENIGASDTDVTASTPPPPTEDHTALNLPPIQSDPLKELQMLSAVIEEDVLQDRLTRVVREFQLTIDDRNRARSRSARSLLRQGAIILQQIGDDSARIALAAQLIQQREKSSSSASMMAKIYANQERRIKNFQHNVDGYADLIVEVSAAYPGNVLINQEGVLRTELNEKDLSNLIEYVAGFSDHIQRFRLRGAVEIDGIKQELGL